MMDCTDIGLPDLVQSNDSVVTSKSYFARLNNLISQLDYKAMDNACELIADAWKNNKQIITFGNGGSALTAMHFINDWNKSIFLNSNMPFNGRSLVDNVGLILAYANDISFEDIFVEQLRNILQPGDLVIAISGSGSSENVIRAVEYANEKNAITLGLCGYGGGRLKMIAQHSLWIQAHDMQLVEDIHMIFGHVVMQKLCNYR